MKKRLALLQHYWYPVVYFPNRQAGNCTVQCGVTQPLEGAEPLGLQKHVTPRLLPRRVEWQFLVFDVDYSVTGAILESDC
jgi:hypothetical protein